MLTIVDLGHKPKSCCYLIELELYPHSEHQPFHILVDAPLEITDLLDFVPSAPSRLTADFNFQSSANTKPFPHRSDWQFDESGKEWIIGKHRFKSRPLYCTVPFQQTTLKSTDSNPDQSLLSPPPRKKRKHSKKGKSGKSPIKKDPELVQNTNSRSLPSGLTQRRVSVDVVLLSNHQSLLGLPYLTKTESPSSTQRKKHKISDDLNNLHLKSHREEALHFLLSTDPITMDDITTNPMDNSVPSEREEMQRDDDSNCIEIVLSSHCKIYATEPTKQYGKLMMKSLASSNAPLFVREHNESGHSLCDDSTSSNDGQRIYTMDDIDECIGRISTMQYNERRGLLPGGELEVICISSGLYIGSSNWILCGSAMALSMAIVMGSCGATNRYPKAISLSPHFDVPGNVDVVLLDDLQCLELNDESANDALSSIERKIVETVCNKGTVIIPSSSCGIAYDLMERIHSLLNKYEYSEVEIVLISSIAIESIALTSIFGDFLHENNGMNHVYGAKYPFGFQTYIANGRLIHCTEWDNVFCFKHLKSNMADSKIILAESPSLRYGDIVHLLNVYNHPKNTLILTDPQFTAHLALSPFTASAEDSKSSLNPQDMTLSKGLKMQTVSYPLDARLQIKELCVLLRKVCPKYAFVPSSYHERISQNMNKFVTVNRQQLTLYQNQSKNTESVPPPNLISPQLLERVSNIQYLTMSNGQYHTVTMTAPNSKRLFMDNVVTQNVSPKNLDPNMSCNVMVSSLSGHIDYHSDHRQVVLRKKDFVNEKGIVDQTFVGNLNVSGLLKRLRSKHGRSLDERFENIRYLEQSGKIVFDLRCFEGDCNDRNVAKRLSVEIVTSCNVTHVRCGSVISKKTHTFILDLVSQYLVSF